MLSTLNAKEPTLAAKDSDPHDVFLIDPEVVLAARADNTSSSPAQDSANRPLAPQAAVAPGVPADSAPAVDASFRATAIEDVQPPRGQSAIAKWAKRAFMGFLFALCSALAAAAWKHHGDTAKQVIASWIPQISAISTLVQEKVGLTGQASPPAVQAGPTDQAAAQPPAPAPPTAESPAQATAVVTPDSSQLLQSMARDIAAMGQQIEQLKASIDQLKAGQEQMSHEMAKAAETRPAVAQSAQPRIAAAVPRPPAPPVRRPRPATTYYPASAAAAPVSPPPQSAPVQLSPEPAADGGPVVRPPMPVR
jgi:hypothetical protein